MDLILIPITSYTQQLATLFVYFGCLQHWSPILLLRYSSITKVWYIFVLDAATSTQWYILTSFSHCQGLNWRTQKPGSMLFLNAGVTGTEVPNTDLYMLQKVCVALNNATCIHQVGLAKASVLGSSCACCWSCVVVPFQEWSQVPSMKLSMKILYLLLIEDNQHDVLDL